MASAAYRSGEKLYNEETGLTHDFTKKGGVVMNEIILPDNAPERFKDRSILWNEVQQIEKRSDAQFAREVEVALPAEMSRSQQIECVREYIRDNFVTQGMIADWALHDKGDGNPHAHIMLTLRGLDEQEKWLPKQKSVFANARDDQGKAIFDPSLPSYDPKNREETFMYRIPQLDAEGNQKTRIRKGKGTEYLWEKITIPVNDWNDYSKAEIWRASWAEHCNRYLTPENQIDHRSYARQGIDRVPTIHEGVTARSMEREGKEADRCLINRNIRERNLIRKQMADVAKEITDYITKKAGEILERFKEFGRSIGTVKGTGRNAGYSGKAAGRDRGNNGGELESAGTVGRIHELKQYAEKTESDITRAERSIADTDQRIAELKSVIKEKEADRNGRLDKLKQRRSAIHAGGNAGSDRRSAEREYPTSELNSAIADIRSFLADISAQEKNYATTKNAARSGYRL